MNESVLHHVWQHRLFKQFALQTCKGEPVEIIDAGRLNRDAGPDFFNAKVRINGTIWAGNVEIHIRSSDWYKHNHHLNAAYDNVVLHVVGVDDGEVYTTKGVLIPQMILAFSAETGSRIQSFLEEEVTLLKCKQELCRIEPVFWSDWKQALMLERFEKKCEDVCKPEEGFVEPDELLYRLIVRSFGTHLNADVFLSLAKSLPLKIVRKYLGQPLSLLALFVGQAGFLSKKDIVFDQEVIREYQFLKKKYGLTEINPFRWKELRTRPQNFPVNRLIQLVVLMMDFYALKKLIAENPTENPTYNPLKKMLLQTGKKNEQKILPGVNFPSGSMSPEFANHLIINAIIPYLYKQQRLTSGLETFEKLVDCLHEIKPERNTLINVWENSGVEINNAFDSQSLIQLTQHYCKEKKCLRCRIGHQVLKRIIELPEISPD